MLIKKAPRKTAEPFINYPGTGLLSQPVARQVPSTLEGLTSVFGMGTGVAPPLIAPGISSLKPQQHDLSNLNEPCTASHFTFYKKGQAKRRISTPKLKASRLVHLVPINLVVSKASSGISILGVGFALRCIQRLSVPNAATQPLPLA